MAIFSFVIWGYHCFSRQQYKTFQFRAKKQQQNYVLYLFIFCVLSIKNKATGFILSVLAKTIIAKLFLREHLGGDVETRHLALAYSL